MTRPVRALAIPRGAARSPTIRTFEVGPGAVPDADPLGPADVAVWLARSDAWATEALRARWAALASKQETRRAARFHVEDDRQTYLAAHGLLRIALSRHGGADPRDWRFVTNRWGRPELAPSSRLRFSLSHTRGLVACAVTIDRDVGLDVEDASAVPPLEASHRFFSAREARALAAVPEGERPARFFENWTLKESFLKATGVGLSRPLAGFSLLPDAANGWRLEGEEIGAEEGARWAFRAWRVSRRWQAALAVELAMAEHKRIATEPLSGATALEQPAVRTSSFATPPPPAGRPCRHPSGGDGT